MLLGDAREGKFADNIVGFGRTLRRAGVPVDSSRMALAELAVSHVGLTSKDDVCAAMECVFISREQDRALFRELFDAYFKDPDVAAKLLSQMLPSAEGRSEPAKRRPRVREALAPFKTYAQTPRPLQDKEVEFDAAMTASDAHQLKHADFNALTASEFRLVEQLARQLALPVPTVAGRRTQMSQRGARLHWRSALQDAARHDGDALVLRRLHKRQQALPLVLLVDISGSMERYARMLLSFLHAATRTQGGRPGGSRIKRDVFAIGTELTNLSAAFRLGDGDDMLASASKSIEDFAGGTRLAHCLAQLRAQHARRLVGRRSIVLLVSDGLDTDEHSQLSQELVWLKRHCRRLLWLNPLLRFDGYAPLASGAQALHRHADAMLAVHNLSKLQDLAQSLQDVFQT